LDVLVASSLDEEARFCEPGKHAACLPGSQGCFLPIRGRLEVRFPFSEQFHVIHQGKVKEQENRAGAKGEFSERMSQVASTTKDKLKIICLKHCVG